jgi:hypothetical protein
VTVPGITPPIIGLGTNQPYVLVGNGYALDASGTLRYDLHMPVSAAAASPIAFELAVVSGTAIRVFSFEQQNQPMLTFSAVVPPVNGMTPTTKLVAYTSDGHRLIIVAGTAAGDVAFTVPR